MQAVEQTILEYRLFLEFERASKEQKFNLSQIARSVATIDVLCSLAEQSRTEIVGSARNLRR